MIEGHRRQNGVFPNSVLVRPQKGIEAEIYKKESPSRQAEHLCLQLKRFSSDMVWKMSAAEEKNRPMEEIVIDSGRLSVGSSLWF